MTYGQVKITLDKIHNTWYTIGMNAPLNIKEIRKSLSMTQEEFAQRVGVSLVVISRWENKKNKPSRLAVEKINQVIKNNS